LNLLHLFYFFVNDLRATAGPVIGHATDIAARDKVCEAYLPGISTALFKNLEGFERRNQLQFIYDRLKDVIVDLIKVGDIISGTVIYKMIPDEFVVMLELIAQNNNIFDQNLTISMKNGNFDFNETVKSILLG